MTREQMADCLELIMVQMGNGDALEPPEGIRPEQWAYVKGIAAGAIGTILHRMRGLER